LFDSIGLSLYQPYKTEEKTPTHSSSFAIKSTRCSQNSN